jgi:hypothetical protein
VLWHYSHTEIDVAETTASNLTANAVLITDAQVLCIVRPQNEKSTRNKDQSYHGRHFAGI